MSTLGKLRYLQSLLLSKKLSRKIVIIESDDWGSERIPNRAIQKKLMELGIDMETNPHSKYDTLERLEDLEALENVLRYIEDKCGKKVVITTNFITSNPDFVKIKQDAYATYHTESFIESYFNRDGNTKVWDKVKYLTGIGYMKAQFHGREHINAMLWLQELNSGNFNFLKAFELGCCAIDSKTSGEHRKNLMAALEYDSEKHKEFIIESLQEGMMNFENYFGFKSTTFIPTRYVWHNDLEKQYKKLGISHLQTSLFQKEPSFKGYINRFHFTGQKNYDSGLTYLVRNAFFEPTYNNNRDWVNQTLSKVDLAFRFNTPAIICSHRINFVGGLDPKQRDSNLNQFKQLLLAIIKTHPEVVFMSTDELVKLI